MDEVTYKIGEGIYWEDCELSGHPSDPDITYVWVKGIIISEKQSAWGAEVYKIVDKDGREHYRRAMHIKPRYDQQDTEGEV